MKNFDTQIKNMKMSRSQEEPPIEGSPFFFEEAVEETQKGDWIASWIATHKGTIAVAGFFGVAIVIWGILKII